MDSTAEKPVPEGYSELKEGQARILQKDGNTVFYNEAQVTNRDLSIAVLRHFLPILAKEKADGLIKKRSYPKQQLQEKRAADAAGVVSGLSMGRGANGQKAKPIANDAGPSSTEDKKDSTEGEASKDESKPMEPPGAVILEGLAASGLRSIRYALEIPGVARIDANDLDSSVCASMRQNCEFNGPEVQAKVRTLCNDARLVMMQNHQAYDVVDLDPYGTPANLLDSAVQAVSEGGILMVTATDMANLCGNNSVACWSNYGSFPIHRAYNHEGALRILLASLESHANRYKRYITPLLSLSIDFYIRIFVRVTTSPHIVKDSACKLAYLWQSSGCDSFHLQRVAQKKEQGKSTKYMAASGPVVPQKCPDTGSGFIMGGPIWAEPIHDFEFVKGLLGSLEADKGRFAQYAKLRGMLTAVLEELPDVPLYYQLHDICRTAKCQPPKAEVLKSAFINAGYRVSGSHANPLALKTDAPPDVLWDIIRCWVKEHPVNLKDVDPESYIYKLLSKPPKLEANFARAKGSIVKEKLGGVTRFVENPAFWGPKSRHGRPPIPKQGAAAAAAGDEAKEEEEAKEGDEAKGEDEVKEGDEAKAGGEKREADAGEEGEGSEEKRQKVA